MSTFDVNPVGNTRPPKAESAPNPLTRPELRRPEDRPEAPQQEPLREPLTQEETQREINQVNEILENLGHRLRFGIYEGTDQFYVQVLDESQEQVIKMMPPEHMLSLRSRIMEAVGVIIDEVK